MMCHDTPNKETEVTLSILKTVIQATLLTLVLAVFLATITRFFIALIPM
jgi:hypothetical protein